MTSLSCGVGAQRPQPLPIRGEGGGGLAASANIHGPCWPSDQRPAPSFRPCKPKQGHRGISEPLRSWTHKGTKHPGNFEMRLSTTRNRLPATQHTTPYCHAAVQCGDAETTSTWNFTHRFLLLLRKRGLHFANHVAELELNECLAVHFEGPKLRLRPVP